MNDYDEEYYEVDYPPIIVITIKYLIPVMVISMFASWFTNGYTTKGRDYGDLALWMIDHSLAIEQTLSRPVVTSRLVTDCPDPRFSEGVNKWCRDASQWGGKYGIPTPVILSLINVESGGNEKAISTDGACGVTQIMPSDGIARQKFGSMFADRDPCARYMDGHYAIQWTARFLRSLVIRYGSLREALYHYGPTGIGYRYADMVLKGAQ